MIASIGLIFVLGLLAGELCRRVGLPRIIGMLLAGVLIGPCALNLLDAQTLSVSAELRRMALVIILLRAGLTLDLGDLRRVGRPAVLMAFLPALFEIGACVLLAPAIFGVSRAEAAVLGAVLGAVSPAVVVPRMVQLIEQRRGTAQGVPQLILAGASLDDVFVIVLFSTFINIAQGGHAGVMDFLNIPISIVLGMLCGATVGLALSWLFETAYARKHLVRNSLKVIIILGAAFLLLALETLLEGKVAVSGLIAVMCMALTIAVRSVPQVTARL